ncbi:MAG: hypothetical protein QXJ17_05495 [Nitrososphaeria archaeon]
MDRFETLEGAEKALKSLSHDVSKAFKVCPVTHLRFRNTIGGFYEAKKKHRIRTKP